tara:strand:+ start:356 stop:562 length:207 start_codon:yes stop_codon:yes gene_type:complete
LLGYLGESRDHPKQVVYDSGTEFARKAMFFWGKALSVKLNFIQAGKPAPNTFCESLNSMLRNERLNQH